jgi:hypothetical protein
MNKTPTHLDHIKRARNSRDTIHDSSGDRALWEIAELLAVIADTLEVRSEPTVKA